MNHITQEQAIELQRNEMTDIAKRLLDGTGLHIDECHKLMHEAVNEIKWLETKLEGYAEWKSAAEWKSELQQREIDRLKCQIELSGRTLAYAEFSKNGNIRMWTNPESATPEQRKSMVPLSISAKTHYSDCAIYNEPAYPAGDCDCGVTE